jgi:hypothetical protein
MCCVTNRFTVTKGGAPRPTNPFLEEQRQKQNRTKTKPQLPYCVFDFGLQAKCQSRDLVCKYGIDEILMVKG